MNLGRNIQHLRKQKKITQERLAEIMSVSRQTISRWEADEIVPELGKLVTLSELFACKLDALVKESLDDPEAIYSDVSIKKMGPFRMARYVMITPNCEVDANGYMRRWAQQAGLLAFQPEAMLIR